MGGALATLDVVVFGGYFAVLAAAAFLITRRRAAADAEDYFLAGRTLPWWVIGASLIASNISTEQIIGMNGTAFESGIAVISYSLIGAAVTLLLVAKFFLPAFLRMRIYSMPQFLRERYDERVSRAMSVFWLLVYVFINLTTVLALGAVTLEAILGVPTAYSVVGLAVVSAAYTTYGGLGVVARTDFLQVGVLVIGGAAVVVLGLDAVAEGGGAAEGATLLWERNRDRFHAVLPASHPELPWTGVFFGGLWIAALSYWGCNQYIIQRALAARSTDEARYGLLFAALLSLVVSVIIVLPGVIAADLYPEAITDRDQAFPHLIRELLPAGWVGLVLASLLAAILSSLNSMGNSVATIFTMDLYRGVVRPHASDAHLVAVGRVTTVVALAIAVAVCPFVLEFGGLFAFIQEFTGFVTPAVLCVFAFGLFWPRANADGALAALALTVPVSVAIKTLAPEIAFLNRMTITFAVLALALVVVSLASGRAPVNPPELRGFLVPSPRAFNLGALAIVGAVVAFYLAFA